MNSLLYIVYFFLGYVIVVDSTDLDINRNEYCIGEFFNPECPSGFILIMTSALYGRMSLGRCLPIDRGDMGCQSNVLEKLDSECSGKPSCNVQVLDSSISPHGGCGKGLLVYLQADYTCVRAEDVSKCTDNSDNYMKLSAKDAYISSRQIQQQCSNKRPKLSFEVDEGQTMNISLVNLESSNSPRDTVYGSLLDPVTQNRMVFSNGVREKHLMASSANKVELTVQDDTSLFLLHIQVIGCKNMQPPTGAWMTRNGDDLEIGCHSGAKSWTLECIDNQWEGAIGQCGQHMDTKLTRSKPRHKVEQLHNPISIDAAVFAMSSVVIFISAIIFLVGVCVLKRKLNKSQKHMIADPVLDPTLNGTLFHSNIQNEALLRGDSNKQNSGPVNEMYVNSNGSSGSGSLKYYVLENNK